MKVVFLIIGAAAAVLAAVAAIKKKDSVYGNEPEQNNPMMNKQVYFIANESDKENADGVKGHLEAVGDSAYTAKFYDKFIKRSIQILITFQRHHLL